MPLRRARTEAFVTGLVLGAGGSTRLGRPKQLLAFGDDTLLHGDKGVWKLLDRRAGDVVEVRVAGPVPLDVNTPEDYQAVLAAAGFAETLA